MSNPQVGSPEFDELYEYEIAEASARLGDPARAYDEVVAAHINRLDTGTGDFPVCPQCGRELFFQHTPETGWRGPFHTDTFGVACPA